MYEKLCAQAPSCGLEQEGCAEEVSRHKEGCRVSCTGLYADIQHADGNIIVSTDSQQRGTQLLADIFDKYNKHKNQFAKNLVFDPTSNSFSKL